MRRVEVAGPEVLASRVEKTARNQARNSINKGSIDNNPSNGETRMKVPRLLFIFLLITSFLITLDSRAILQEVKTEVILYDDYFGHVPLPENAIELETKFSFNSLDLQHPVQMANDTSGNIYFTEKIRNVVLKFDSSGEYLCQEEGKIEATYWKDCDVLYKPSDFLVQKIGNQKRFYVLQSAPDRNVDVFVLKHK